MGATEWPGAVRRRAMRIRGTVRNGRFVVAGKVGPWVAPHLDLPHPSREYPHARLLAHALCLTEVELYERASASGFRGHEQRYALIELALRDGQPDAWAYVNEPTAAIDAVAWHLTHRPEPSVAAAVSA